MSDLEYQRLLAIASDPDYDEGPELPPDEQADPDDPGLWAISAGGPIAWNQQKAAARCDRWWREHPEARRCEDTAS